jgi:hypothetical protein
VGTCIVGNPYVKWEDVLEWGVNDLKGTSHKVSFCKLAIGIVIYHIWKQRNDLRHRNVLSSEEQILKRIDREICTPVMGAGKFENPAVNKAICCR